MKNKYFGDVGDFGKYGLLSMVLETGLRLGINWYLTEDDNSTDGKYVEYLNNIDFINCDHELHGFLRKCILDNNRGIKKLRNLPRFNQTPAYEDVLKIDDIKALSEAGRKLRERHRINWFEKSISELNGCDIIFCDPDNGIETKSLSKTRKDSVKYVYINEIEEMVNRGHSVIIYNHRDRSKESDYMIRFKEVHRCVMDKTDLRIIRFNRYSVRDYLFFIQNEHKIIINKQIEHFLNNHSWNKLFCELLV